MEAPDTGRTPSGGLAGRVALITGAARGQGRSHATRLARAGADIIALDICRQIPTVGYPLSTSDDLGETVRQVSGLGVRVVGCEADVRDMSELRPAIDSAVAELGNLDIVIANAGIAGSGVTWELTESAWRDMIDVNVTGVWHTAKATIPHLVSGGLGGSIIITASTAGVVGYPRMAHYTASKHATVGLMRALAIELGRQSIRVNCVLPTYVDSPTARLSDLDPVARDQLRDLHALPLPRLDVGDISDGIAFLVSDEASHITGTALPIDAGMVVTSSTFEARQAMEMFMTRAEL